MKIFVASAPKTGNTWLTLLLSTIYDLEPVSLPFPFEPDVATRMGSDWIALQHYRPEPEHPSLGTRDVPPDDYKV